MTQSDDFRHSPLNPGDRLHGYRVDRVADLPEIDSSLSILVHETSGARHVHIHTADKENAFGVAFKTVPADSTGVAHILEHTALCGSSRYPVRDPFFSMLKRSLSTFMNAFTASDWTMYPFATQNAKDFYNLMDVYLDAAFFPRLADLSFKQEGHRLEFVDGKDDQPQLVYKGVVYNEMKGAMSSPDQVMARGLLKALYPDTTYANNSGGEPAVIPRLTHAQLKAFHQVHYHPSNAFFYTYGHLPLDRHLEVIEKRVLSHFARINPDTDVPNQPRWQAPRQVVYPYPFSDQQDAERKCQVCLAWLTTDITDTFEVLVMAVIEQVLLGNAASPLRKALMDSGLGSALSDATGFDADNRDTLFACGLKDVAADDAEQIETIIMDTLTQLADGGIDAGLVDSAVHQIEFHRKEITNTPYPYGLKLLMRLIGAWLHGGRPERILRLEDDFEQLRQHLSKGGFLEGRIRTTFLENTHRVRFTLKPDATLAQKEDMRVKAELEKVARELNTDQAQRIRQDTEALARLQDTVEDVSCLPTLQLDDITPSVPCIQADSTPKSTSAWCYRQPTSGIFYFSGAASAATVPVELMPLVPFFGYAFSKVGTRDHDYTTIARRIDAVTGGLSLSAQARTTYDGSNACLPVIAMNGKCLVRNQHPMFELMSEMVDGIDFSNRDRLRQLLGEYRAGLETMVVHNGHRLAISLAARSFSPANRLNESWSGIHQLRAIKQIDDQADDSRLGHLAEDLQTIANAVFAPGNLRMAIIGERPSIDTALATIDQQSVLSAFAGMAAQPELAPVQIDMDGTMPSEGWTTSTAVAFVAQAKKAVAMSSPDAPALAVLAKLLRSLYLHREIREKGGAYGGFALYNPENGTFAFGSYRDPQITNTLTVFNRADAFIQSSSMRNEDIKEAILQVCSEIDKPDPPGPAARKAFYRQIVGLDDETRRQFKSHLLAVDIDRVKAVSARYLAEGQPAGVAVIAGKERLEKANQNRNTDDRLNLEAI